MGTEMPHAASPESALLNAQSAVKDVENRPAYGSFAAYLELTKPRILILILLTSIAGFCLASQGSLDKKLLLHLNIGVGLLAAGIGALNQFFERDIDGLMRRTERRPLPSGRISPAGACLFGILTSVLGVAYLALFINTLSAVVGLSTLISYVFLYTPLKRKTTSSTFIGAFPGAVPPLIGWTAVRGQIGTEAL